MLKLETYLGDGAYAEFDGYGITVYTSTGIGRTNTIYFEPEVTLALEEFFNEVRRFCKESKANETNT